MPIGDKKEKNAGESQSQSQFRRKRISHSNSTFSEVVVSSSTVSPGTPIENMYKVYEKLNSAEDKTTLDPEFRELLSCIHRSDKEKRLASQFITRFLEYFPLHYHEAIDALLDLCEHDDVSMRRQVVRDLITVCKKITSFVPKIADVFGQLMQTSDHVEYISLQSSIVSLFHIDGQAALVGIFSQINRGQPLVKDRCIKFVCTKMKELSPEITTLDFERTLFSEVKRVLRSADRTQFNSLLALLKETKFFRQLNGQQSMVDILADQLSIESDFDASDVEEVNRLYAVLKDALPIFSSQVSATRFIVYLCTKVVPQFRNKLTQESEHKKNHEILRMLAEITAELRQIDDKDVVNCLDALHEELVDSMPTPILGSTDHPDFQFSRLEILLFVFHKLSLHKTDYLILDEDRLKDFRVRMQYLARGAQTFMKILRDDLEGKKGDALKTDETRFKIISLKMTSNISALIRDMFHVPPIFKVNLPLSWNPASATRSGSALKRPSMRAITAPTPRNERERELYQPPGGKFSSRAGAYISPVRVRGSPGNFSWGGHRGMRYTGYRGIGRRLSRPDTAKY